MWEERSGFETKELRLQGQEIVAILILGVHVFCQENLKF